MALDFSLIVVALATPTPMAIAALFAGYMTVRADAGPVRAALSTFALTVFGFWVSVFVGIGAVCVLGAECL
jgi:hypothetical protein